MSIEMNRIEDLQILNDTVEALNQAVDMRSVLNDALAKLVETDGAGNRLDHAERAGGRRVPSRWQSGADRSPQLATSPRPGQNQSLVWCLRMPGAVQGRTVDRGIQCGSLQPPGGGQGRAPGVGCACVYSCYVQGDRVLGILNVAAAIGPLSSRRLWIY